jgi:hypothetical protein
MKRAFLLPVLAASLLAGCVYGEYAYRGGTGDYYYGRPYVDYGYYGGYYGGYYPYGYYRYGYPYAYPYRYGYGYGYPYGYYPYRPYYPYRHHHHHSRPGGVIHPDPDRGSPHRSDRAPWRDLGRIPRGQVGQSGPSGDVRAPSVQPRVAMPPRSASEPRRDGSATGTMVRRASEPRRRGESVVRQQP